jgi:hypothetical protein
MNGNGVTMNSETEGPQGFEARLLARLTELDAARPAAATASVPARAGRPRWRRPVVVGAAALAALAVGATATAAALSGEPFDVQGASTDVHPGGYLFLKGSGCPAGKPVAFLWDGAALADTVAQPGNLFWVNASVPADAVLGRHLVTARCGRDLTVRLTVTVSPARPPVPMPPDFAVGGTAAAHNQFVVKGAGCRPGATVTFTAVGLAAQTAVTDDQGAYTAILSVGDLAVGIHQITASCLDRKGAALVLTAELTVVPADVATATAKPSPSR